MTIQRALISVSDKTGVAELAHTLATAGVTIISTGGTARALREAGVESIDVADVTGFPEIMDGRVKTLHPKVHGGLLARPGVDDAALATHDIDRFDLVVVNLYPFAATLNRPNATTDAIIEQIDIGGPAMIRAAAKNHAACAVVVDPADYATIAAAATEGTALSDTDRRTLAAKAFSHTAAYDSHIARWLTTLADAPVLGADFALGGQRVEMMRYGENPHQNAAFYRDAKHQPGSLANAEVVQGKALSYNNIADSDAALECVRQFGAPACVIVKHANPCGVAVAANLAEAYDRAFQTDPTSAFGGIIAFNGAVDEVLARAIVERQFVEVVIAPAFTDAALQAFAARKNVRVLATGELGESPHDIDIKRVSGGFLVQDRDGGVLSEDALSVPTERQPTASEWDDLRFAWQVV
ncbi:MAG: bifunctional phosphoribosylaminoimidazolecarboxamide formyltransferase/IMP cyclohydrolase, partial [Pseudomonadota bacterium]